MATPATPTSATPSPSLLPAVGSVYASREDLHSLIRENGKQRGYIFKQSITSSTKVNWYCSNKYGGPKCLAGFRALLQENGEWLVVEAGDHNDACTRVRQKVLSRKGADIPEDGTLPPVQSSYSVPATPVATTGTSASTANTSVARTRATTRSTMVEPSAKRRATSRSMSSVVASGTGTGTRSKTSRVSPPNSSAVNAVPQLQSAFFGLGSLENRERGGKFRPRSYSQTSTSTTASSNDPTRTPGPSLFGNLPRVTIIDPSFHFPGVDLEGVFESVEEEGKQAGGDTLKATPSMASRKRKRSASTTSSSAVSIKE